MWRFLGRRRNLCFSAVGLYSEQHPGMPLDCTHSSKMPAVPNASGVEAGKESSSFEPCASSLRASGFEGSTLSQESPTAMLSCHTERVLILDADGFVFQTGL
mmetsp:Transcript_93556/g.165511  ORF Transcript_93556/g.165511 Transcript_93556/m.165511 type:complete len:102 (-) Transcript_93556:738-1043(-)